MDNQQIAEKLDLIADLLEIRGDVIYKILAYRKAAESLRELGRDVSQIHESSTLQEIPGVGKAISEKIQELLETGSLSFLEELKTEVPPSLVEWLEVPGLGPKRVGQIWQALEITTLDELQSAAQGQKLRALDGLGPKTEDNIISGVESLKKRAGRTRLGDALPFAEKLLQTLREIPQVTQAQAGGSLRRMRETVGDLDLLAASEEPKTVMETFLNHPLVAEIVSSGDVKSSVSFKGGMRAQLWVHPPERFGTALQFATGAKDHNLRLRELALDQGYSLSERALLRVEDENELLFEDERDLYKTLGLAWIPPELREDRGEIQAAKEGTLPVLIEQGDVISELHSHSKWSDGKFSIKEMALGAIQRGYEILAVTDHSQSLGIAGGLTGDDLKAQKEAIRRVQEELGDQITLLQGIEMEILADGKLDFPDWVLAELDIVIASLHTSMRQSREKATARILRAIQNPYVDIIGHPTNRLIGKREPADLDMDRIFEAAAEQGTALEVNANPMRLDLSDVYVRRAVQDGIPISINTDAHAPEEFDYLPYGLATARRGWASAENVINTWPKKRLLDWLSRNQ